MAAKDTIILKFTADVKDTLKGTQEIAANIRGVGKATKGVTDSAQKAVNFLGKQLQLEQQINKELSKQSALQGKFLKSIDKINAAPRLNEALKVNAALASVRSYNKALDESQAKVNKLSGSLAGFNLATRSGGNTSSEAIARTRGERDFSSLSVLSGKPVRTKTIENQYAELFDTLEAKEREYTETVIREEERRLKARALGYGGAGNNVISKPTYIRNAQGTVAENRAKRDQEEYAKLFGILEAKEREYTKTVLREEERRAKARTLGFGAAGANVISKPTYVPNAQGAVTENRARKAQEEFELVERLREQYQAKEKARLAELENYEKQIAARRLNTLKARITNEEDFAKAARDRELAALKQSILARDELLKRRANILATTTTERTARLEAAVQKEIAIEQHGIGSIEAARVAATEKTRRLRNQLDNYTLQQQQKVASGLITSTEATRNIAKAQQDYKKAVIAANKALNEQERLHQQSIRTQRNLFVRIGEIFGIYQVYAFTLNTIKKSFRDIVTSGIEQQANRSPITAIFGSIKGEKNLQFISKVADRAGQDLQTLERTYAKYASSARLAGATQEEVNKSFQEFAEVGTLLSLTPDKLDSVFLALDQIYAKGVVQSEEIKKQLGNVLPGAVELAAQSVGKVPAEFLKAMQRNEVIAKEFVPKFAKYIRDIFGGEDDKVFKQISNRLLFNYNRTINIYTELSRKIFNKIKGSLNSLARTVGDALTSVTNNLNGIGQALQILTVLLGTRLTVAFGAALLSLTNITSKANTFLKVLTGFSAPTLGLIGIFGTMAAKLAGLSFNYDQASGFTVTFKNKTVSLTSYLKATGIVIIDELTGAYEGLNTVLESISGANLTAIFDNIIPNKQDVNEFLAFFDTLDNLSLGQRLNPKPIDQIYNEALKARQQQQTVQDRIINEALAGDIESTLEDLNGRTTQAVIDAIAAGKLENYKDITKALNAAVDIAPAPVPEQGEGVVDIDRKHIRNLYKNLERDSKNYSEAIAAQLEEINYKYERGIIGIEEYFALKRKLEDADITRQFENAAKIENLAAKYNDADKLDEITDRIENLKTKGNAIQRSIDRERLDALFEYADLQRSVEEDYLRLLGKRAEADKLAIEQSFAKNIAIAAENGNKEMEKMLNTLKKGAIAAANINALEKQRELQNSRLALQEAEIQSKIQLGLISRMDGYSQLNELQLQRLDNYDEEIVKLREIQAANSDNVEVIRQINDILADRASQAPTSIADSPQGYTGQFSFLNDFEDGLSKVRELNALRKENDEKYKEAQKPGNELLAPYKDAIGTHQEFLDTKAALDSKYAEQTGTTYANLFASIGSLGSSVFGELAESAAKMYGAQSKEAKKAFLLYKATKIAEIVAATALAVINALAQGGPYAGPVLAGVAAALGAVQVAKVVAQQPPAAHGGLGYVPKEQTYLLDKGERVLSPNQNRDFTQFINNNTPSSTQKPEVNIRNINVYDPSVVGDYFATPEGEEVFVNLLRRNEATA